MQPQRAGLGDERAENPAAARQVADRRVRLGVDAGGEEALELRAAGVDHAERAVRAPVSSAASSTMRCSSVSRESSELSAIPASRSARRRSLAQRVSRHRRQRTPCGKPARRFRVGHEAARLLGPDSGRMVATASHPSASFSATIRVRLDDRPGSFARLATAIGEAGGSLGAIDLVASRAA